MATDSPRRATTTRHRTARDSTRTGFANATFDARPDRLDFRDKRYTPPLRSLAPRHPGDAFLAEHLPAYLAAGLILDQGREGACTGFGLACVINYLLFVRRRGDDFRRVSPRMLYELARRYDEWRGEDYDGSSCRGALKGWHKHGVCADELWPYRDAKGNVRLLRPKPEWASDAVRRPLGVYYRINRRSVVDMQAALQEIGAIYVSAKVHDGWDRVPTAGAPRAHAEIPTIPAIADRRKTGGHAFALVGYDERGFIVQNSWGPQWAAGGFAVMPYTDWVAYGSDAWATALGVPQERTVEGIEALRWPARSGRSLAFFDLDLRNPANPPDDPWPIDHEFLHAPYQPWSTATAYAHTLVTGNNGHIVVTDVASGTGDANLDGFLDELLVARPAQWLSGQRSTKLMIYAHGGLNSEEASLDRIRVLAPYFEANGIYPLFLTWRTGVGETLVDLLEDRFRALFGSVSEEDLRAAGFWDDLAEKRDRRIEEVANRALRSVWSEMRRNAALGAAPGRGLCRLASRLARLRDRMGTAGIELHLVGHSAGSILLGHLLPLLADPGGGAEPVKVSTCSLYAAACSVGFAVKQYLNAGRPVLRPEDIHLDYLSDDNEREDYLAGIKTAGLHLYGKSLLYLVSRALDDARKMPLLGLQRAIETSWYQGDRQRLLDEWNADELRWIERWLAEFKGTRYVVDRPSVIVDREGRTAQARHGSFDNDVDVITRTILRITGEAALAHPIEWLDY